MEDVLRRLNAPEEGNQGDHRRLFGGVAVEQEAPEQVQQQGCRHEAHGEHPGGNVFPEGMLPLRVGDLVLAHAEFPDVHHQVGDGVGHDEIAGVLRGPETGQDHEQEHGLEGRQAGGKSVPEDAGALNAAGAEQEGLRLCFFVHGFPLSGASACRPGARGGPGAR